MMTKQPLFPLADTPDVDLEQAGGTNVAVDETFATAERIQLDGTSRAAITSAVDIVTSGRSDSRLHVLLAVMFTYSCPTE